MNKKKVLAFVLAAAMVTSMMPAVSAAEQQNPNLILSYDFEQADGTTVKDLSGNNENGTLVGNAKLADGGVTGKGLRLDGSTGTYLKMPGDITNGLTEMTVSAFAKASSATPAFWARIFDFGNPSKQSYLFLTESTETERNQRVALSSGNSWANERYAQSSVKAVLGSKFNHYAVTIKGNTLTLYLNGQKTGEVQSIDAVASLNAFTEAFIGKSQFSADAYYNGTIDNFNIYNKALNADEIQSVYTSGLSDNEILDAAVAQLDVVKENGLAGSLVKNDLVLKTKAFDERVSISWDSSAEEVISNDGKVVRPETAQAVTLTATISAGAQSKSKAFELTVLGVNEKEFTINVNAAKKKADVGEDMFGLFFEDINKGADGGLNPELLENRSFEYDYGGLRFWNSQNRTGVGSVSLQTADAMNKTNPHVAKFNVTSAGYAYLNDGHKGVPVVSGEKYHFSIWVKNSTYTGDLKVAVEDNAKNKMTTEAVVAVEQTGEWTKYTAEITGLAQGNGKFVLTFDGKGVLLADFISLIPDNTWKGDDPTKWPKGGMRKDLVQALADLEPGFVRFPGGCVTEGHDWDNVFNWKNTVGPLEERKEMRNGPWRYWQSYGIGYHEYFQMCEDIGAQALPVVAAGMTCQFANPTILEPGDPRFEQWIQDTLDLIEYANGDVSTEWGAKRAEAGHPESFNLKYLAIGNENWGEKYLRNFKIMKEAVKAKYPDIIICSSSGAGASGKEFDYAWDIIDKEHRDTLVDEHYYMSPEWFIQNTNRYDYYDRASAKVFLGEYAAHGDNVNGKRANSQYSAVAEAAFLTGVERNADVVQLVSYAPLFAKVDEWQWAPDMIWFDNFEVMYTPNYYVQQMFSTNLGDQVVDLNTQSFTETSVVQNGGIALASWDTAVEYDNVKVVSNATGEVIFEDDFADGMDPLWKVKRGNWSVQNGVLKQTNTVGNNKEDMIYIDGVDWEDYTLTVDSKKTAGAEGFLIGFAVDGPEEYTWYNAGGWGNTADAIEKKSDGTKFSIGSPNKGTFSPIAVGTTYKMTVKCKPESFKIQKNDVVIADREVKATQDYVFSSVTRDSKTGEIFLKLVNTESADKEVSINLQGADLTGMAVVKTLASDEKMAENSMENKMKVAPEVYEMPVSETFDFTVPAYSCNVIVINGEIEDPLPEEGLKVKLEDVPNISGNAGDTFNLPVTLNDFPTDGQYRGIEAVVQIPAELEVKDVLPNLNISDVSFKYNVDADNNLRFAFISTEKNDVTFDAQNGGELVKLVLAPKNTLEAGTVMSLSVNRFLARTADQATPFELTGATSTISVASSGIEITAAARELFVGDGVDVIPADKKAVAVEFTGLGEKTNVLFGDVQMYFSAQKTLETGKTTYVALIDAATPLDHLGAVENYTITDTGIMNITFGDRDEDGHINASDALAIVETWLRKLPADDKQMMALNVTADGKIDTQDAIGVVDYFISSGATPLAIVKK